MSNVLVLCALATAGIAAYIFIGLDGWAYYSTPTAVRGYAAGHALLRPAGRVGHLFGVIGFAMMLAPVAYGIRKKAARLQQFGSMKTWLDVHVFCGVIGPVFVTFHTSFKFGGLISVAYWSMVAVVSSGFIGRYLFVRIPRSIRGIELGQADLDRRAAELGASLFEAGVPDDLLRAIDAFEQRVVPRGEVSYAALLGGDGLVSREAARFRARVAEIDGAPHVLLPDNHRSRRRRSWGLRRRRIVCRGCALQAFSVGLDPVGCRAHRGGILPALRIYQYFSTSVFTDLLI